jgi:WD40 repeat protein
MGMPRQDPADPYSVQAPKPRFPHPVRISTAALSRDGSILLALDVEGNINAWNVRSKRLLYRRPTLSREDLFPRLTCSPDGRYVAISARYFPQSSVRVLELGTGDEVRRFARGFSPAFSPDGEFLAVSDGPALRRWALKSGAELPSLHDEGPDLKWVAYSPRGDRIAASVENSGDLWIWDVATRRRVALGAWDSGHVTGLAFSPDGGSLAIGTWSGVRFWNLKEDARAEGQSHEEYTRGLLRYSGDGGRLVAQVRQAWILVWDIATGRSLQVWRAFQLSDGLIELSEAADVAIWSEKGGIRLERIPEILAGEKAGHLARSVAFMADGRVLTGNSQGELRFWDPATQKELRRIAVPPRPVRGFSEDGTLAIFGGGEEAIQLWDISAGKDVFRAEPKLYVNALALSPDRSTLALGHSEGTLSLWDVATRRERCRVRLDVAGVTVLAWSSTGKKLAWGDELGGVVIAEGKNASDPLIFKPRGRRGVRSVRFSPDAASLLAVDGDGQRWLYRDEAGVEPIRKGSISTGIPLDERWQASGYLQPSEIGIVQEAISPDRTYVAGITSWGTLLIWEAPGGR